MSGSFPRLLILDKFLPSRFWKTRVDPYGNTGLHDVEPVDRNAEFGIVIGEKPYWNKGYGKKATRLMLQHGFEDLNLHRIYLYVFENNQRGMKAYEGAGFTKEGRLER